MRTHGIIAAAAIAALALVATPAIAEANDRHHDKHGVYVSVGHGSGFWFGYRNRHYVNHAHEYRRVERRLVEKRTKLLRIAQRAFGAEDFEKTQRLLTRLVSVDHKLQEHRGDHTDCHH